MKRKAQQAEQSALMNIADMMCLAARTAPKAKGRDNLECVILTGEDIALLATEMLKLGEENNNKTFLRDSGNIANSQAVVLFGARHERLNLRLCGFCGAPDCDAAEEKGVLCAYASGDLGIAIGSAISVATDHRVDNRVMYTAGVGAIRKGFLGEDIAIAFGIPLSCSAKNPFFDRKPPAK